MSDQEKLAKKFHKMMGAFYVNADMDETTDVGSFGTLKRDLYVEENTSIQNYFGVQVQTEVRGSGGGMTFSSQGDISISVKITGSLGNSSGVRATAIDAGVPVTANMSETSKHSGLVSITFHRANAYILSFSNYIVEQLTNERAVNDEIVQLYKEPPHNDWRKEFAIVTAARIAESGLIIMSKKKSLTVNFDAEVTSDSSANFSIGQELSLSEIQNVGLTASGGLALNTADAIQWVLPENCTPIVELKKLKGYGNNLRLDRL